MTTQLDLFKQETINRVHKMVQNSIDRDKCKCTHKKIIRINLHNKN